MSNLIKEGYFNLSTMLNLKSLWMYQLNTSKPEHTSINNGSMNFKVQAMFKWRLVNSGLHTWVHLSPAYRMDVLKGDMVIFDCRWLLHFWCELKQRRTHRPCWLRWLQGWVIHTTSVHEPWALLACSIGTMIGGAKHVSFHVCEWVPNGLE